MDIIHPESSLWSMALLAQEKPQHWWRWSGRLVSLLVLQPPDYSPKTFDWLQMYFFSGSSGRRQGSCMCSK